jgi:hypothetical protein
MADERTAGDANAIDGEPSRAGTQSMSKEMSRAVPRMTLYIKNRAPLPCFTAGQACPAPCR